MNKKLEFRLMIYNSDFIIKINKSTKEPYYLITDDTLIIHNGNDITYFLLYNLFLTFINKEKRKLKSVFELIRVISITDSPGIANISPEVVADFIAKFILKHFEEKEK